MNEHLSLALQTKIIEQEIDLLKALFTQAMQDSNSINELENFSLRNIIKLIPGNLFWKDKEGKYLGVNNNVAKIFKLNSPDDVIGKRNSDLLDPTYSAKLDQFDNECIESGQGRYFEENGPDENNNPAIYFTQKLPLKNAQNEIIGLVGISMDITARKKIENELKLAKERAEASNLAKSQFLAVVNHELRTPLTGILGLVDMLKKNPNGIEEKKHIVDDLDNCAQYLLALVNDVLDFTKFDANGTKIKSLPVNFKHLANDVFSIVGGLAKNKGLEIKHFINDDIPLLLTDGKAFSQILINIINNAIKFTNTGCVSLSILHEKLLNEKIALEIKVADTGLGIPKDKIDLIFEPFKQLEDTYIRQSSRSGTGLGLTIVKQLAQLLNCNIHVESTLGKGSTFTVTGEFDMAPPDATATQGYLKSAAKEIGPLTKPRLEKIKTLLVEDDRIVQLIHRHMLTDLHCDVDLAHCGQEALSLLGQHDIAFVDIGLSDMTGFELIKTMREHQKKTQHFFPIIALTGYTGEVEKSACLEAGANEVAVKPISLEKLGELLERYC